MDHFGRSSGPSDVVKEDFTAEDGTVVSSLPVASMHLV